MEMDESRFILVSNAHLGHFLQMDRVSLVDSVTINLHPRLYPRMRWKKEGYGYLLPLTNKMEMSDLPTFISRNRRDL